MTLLRKMVDGADVAMSEEEDAATRAEWAATDADNAANGYKLLRRTAYPPIADYVDGIVKGDDAQVQAYIDACLAVKALYPKP